LKLSSFYLSSAFSSTFSFFLCEIISPLITSKFLSRISSEI